MDWDVTIGIPVYNGEAQLEMTLNSLVKNHLGVREIIISDNASTDRTPEIIKLYAEKYDNIKPIRQPKTISFWENHLATLKLAKGKYFMFLGHHDLISENYFSELVPLLEGDPQAVIAIPSIRAFLKTLGDLPEEKQGRYFDPLKSGVMSDNLRERVNAVLKNPRTCYMFTQLFPTEVIRKIWAEIYSQHCPHLDHVSAMCTVLLGKCKASDKAFYYFESSDRLDETPEKRRQRYSRNFQTFIPSVNDHGHVPRRYWQLCQKFAPNISDELLYHDIKVACSQFMDADFDDEDWLERHVVMSPPNVAAPPPVSRAYRAISAAIKAEKIRQFYQKSYAGQNSEFRPIAEQRANYFYLRMLEILINEKYLAPVYRLTNEETELFSKLVKLKSYSQK